MTMHCTSCGAPMNADAKFCTSCGAPAPQATYQQPAQPTYQQPTYQQPAAPVYQPPVPGNLSWKEFYNRFVTKKGNVTAMVVVCFVTTALCLALLGLTGSPLCILDIALYLSMGILLLSTKQWVFALIPTVYGGIATVINIATEGTPSGIAALAIGIAAIQTLTKANKAYQQYKLDGILPNKPI